METSFSVPSLRVSPCNTAEVNAGGDYVLYWMIANRRTHANFALQHALDYATSLKKPLLVLEALRVGYPWACRRFHQFITEGMFDNKKRFSDAGIRYHAYVEPQAGAGKGLLKTLAAQACVVITDNYPCFFLPKMVASAGDMLNVRMEQVDSNGLLPLAVSERAYPTAAVFRRHLQKYLPNHLLDFPFADPLEGSKPASRASIAKKITEQWPAASDAILQGRDDAFWNELPIDHAIGTTSLRGGSVAARDRLRTFLDTQLVHYAEHRNEPENEVTSRLSPYLHFGHISVHEAAGMLFDREDWHPGLLYPKTTGSREGWWGLSKPAEAFMDELVTWREVGFNVSYQRPDSYDDYESLPDWAKKTLAEHEDDPREHIYSLEQFETAQTHDPLWNAAQNQLVREGYIHNYLRMLWGKKILEWTKTPRDALAVMTELNNKYAIDGRDPNSYSGIFWTLGRFDRPWGPERPIFGKIRYMTSKNTAKKVSVKNYIAKYNGNTTEQLSLQV